MHAVSSLRPALRLLLAAILILASLPARAGDAETLDQLRTAQIAVYAIVRDFHMQTLLTGDRERTEQLNRAIADTGALLGSIEAGDNAALGKAVQAAQREFAGFSRAAKANNVVRDGYTDDILVGDLYASAEQLTNALQQALAAVPGGNEKARQLADRSHAANLLMQRSAAAYLKRSAQMSPDIGAEIPYDLGEATRELDKRMTALAKELAGNKAAGAAMRSVMTKWNFIKGSLLNYNEKAVPFIVDRYATQVKTGLQQVVTDLTGS